MMDGNEIYLGGFYSPRQLTIGRFGVGVGLYATNRRLFIFRKDVDNMISKIASHMPFVAPDVTPEQNQAILDRLSSESSQMFFRKEWISTLELKDPPAPSERDI